MSSENIQHMPDVRQELSFPDVIIQQWHGTRAITETFAIDEQFLLNLPNFGTVRTGDKFTLIKNPDGSGVLRKIRTKVEPGERRIDKSYYIPKEAFVVDKPKTGINEKPLVRDFLSNWEKNELMHDEVFKAIVVWEWFIEYKGNRISINTKPGNEKQVQLLLAQMIIRGLYDKKKWWITQQIRQILGKSYYENDRNDIDANNWYLLDTTIVTRDLLFQLFSFGNKLPWMDQHNEQKVVADLLINFLNWILKQEMQNKAITATL